MEQSLMDDNPPLMEEDQETPPPKDEDQEDLPHHPQQGSSSLWRIGPAQNAAQIQNHHSDFSEFKGQENDFAYLNSWKMPHRPVSQE